MFALPAGRDDEDVGSGLETLGEEEDVPGENAALALRLRGLGFSSTMAMSSLLLLVAYST